jgi:type II restriction enzyme
MRLNCNPALADGLTSPSQRTRVITEGWMTAEGYCLNCTSPHLEATAPGTPFRDHICPKCGLGYELKSARSAHTRVVQDGGYDSMMREIRRDNPPALMLLQYDPAWCVRRLVAVHPVFLTPAVIRKRPKPHLRPRTGTPYWMCDFNLDAIPSDGKIVVVSNAKVRPPKEVREAFAKSKPFADIPLAQRGWTALVLAAVRKINKPQFTLAEVYAHEATMQSAYPNNTHIRDKIRQQLQVLRDMGYIDFDGGGKYSSAR